MIVFNKENRVFTLHTRNTTYQMKADWHNILLHTYYGPRISGGDLSYLIQYADRGFSPNPNEVGDKRDYSLDTLPQEYSSCGVGDFRIPSIEFEPEDGSRLADLRYAGHELYRGKYKLEGLPSCAAGTARRSPLRRRGKAGPPFPGIVYAGENTSRPGLIASAMRILPASLYPY